MATKRTVLLALTSTHHGFLRGDAQNQAYSMPVFRYANVYLGLVSIFRVPEDRVHTELAWSPDSVTWHRIQPGAPLIGNSVNEGDYDWGCVYAAASPVVLDKEIRIYYAGSDGKHTSWRNGFLCIATLRLDGWAGYEQVQAEKPGIVTTHAFRYTGRPIRVTADVENGGSVKVSILDAASKELAAAKPLAQTVTGGELALDRKIQADSIRLRFELKHAKAYSFSFEPPAEPKAASATAAKQQSVAATAADAPSRPPTKRTRFLVLDSRLIEKTENAQLTVGTVQKDRNNPLFKEDKPCVIGAFWGEVNTIIKTPPRKPYQFHV